MEQTTGEQKKRYPPAFLKKFLCSVSFKKKLIMVYVFIVLMPTLLAGAFLSARLHSMAVKTTVSQTLSHAAQTELHITDALRRIVSVSDTIYTDEGLAKIVAKRYESSWAVVNAMKNYTTFDDYGNYYKEIGEIDFYISSQNLIGNYNYIQTTKDIENYSWYGQTAQKKGLICWNYIVDEDHRNLALAQTRLLRDPSGLELGMLVILPDTGYLSSFLSGDAAQTFLVGENDVVIAAANQAYVGQTLKFAGLEIGKEYRLPNVYQCSFQEKSAMAAIREFSLIQSEEKLRIVSVFSAQYIFSEANTVLFSGFAVILVSLLLALMLVIIFSDMLSRRIQILSREMHSIASGNLKEEITVDGSDEIGTLSHDLSRMVGSINDLIDQVYLADMQKNQMLARQKEIRYKMLASQTNPHFLFNALESIRMNAHANGCAQLATNVKLLGKILRASLCTDEEQVRLSRELQLVENYLLFQQFRFAEKLSYKIDFGNARTDTKMLPMLIQPIVENCVVHGVEPSTAPCTIRICLWEEKGTLSITVADDGVGISAEHLIRLRETIELPDTDGTHIGLHNVHQRIRLFYGREYGVRIEGLAERGTCTVICIPSGPQEDRRKTYEPNPKL